MEKIAYTNSESLEMTVFPMVEYLRLYNDIQRCGCGLRSNGCWTERSRQMEKGVWGDHTLDCSMGDTVVASELRGSRRLEER